MSFACVSGHEDNLVAQADTRSSESCSPFNSLFAFNLTKQTSGVKNLQQTDTDLQARRSLAASSLRPVG